MSLQVTFLWDAFLTSVHLCHICMRRKELQQMSASSIVKRKGIHTQGSTIVKNASVVTTC